MTVACRVRERFEDLETFEKIGCYFVLCRSCSHIFLIRKWFRFAVRTISPATEPIKQIYSLDHPNKNLNSFIIEGG